MFSLLWKAPLVLILAVLVAAASLVSYARTRLAAITPVQLEPALRPPPDGLVRAKQAAAHAVELEALRGAVQDFNNTEGRPPESFTELAATGYLRRAHVPADLRPFRYDPHSMSVTEDAR